MQQQGPDRKQAAPILERIRRRCCYLGDGAARLLKPPAQPEGKQRELKASAKKPVEGSPMAKARIETALAEAAKWASTLTVACRARKKAASALAAALEPLAQVLKDQGSPKLSSHIEHYHKALDGLNQATRRVETLRDTLEASYPEQAVLSAVHAVREEMAERLLGAQAMVRLVERVKTELAACAQADELPQTMANLYKTWQDDIIELKRKIASTQLEVDTANHKLRNADDEKEQQKLEETASKLKTEFDTQQKALAKRHREFRQAWDHLATNAQQLRLELLLPIYWEVQMQKKPPAWVRFWASQFDTGGLLRTDITWAMYLNPEKIVTIASSHPVYMASREGKRVALKVFTVAKEDRRKFHKEARLLKRLGSHPHIASVNLTFWVPDPDPKINQVYLEMPWYGGGNLASWFEAKRKPSKEEIRIVFRQLLMGLQHIHANGVVHCDIKPENVFLEEGPALQIKIGDFDVSHDKDERATLAAEHGRTSLTVRGFTPMYMAPELQNTGSRCSEASDVYAAGLMFYDMLMGAAHKRPPPPSVPSLASIQLQPAERNLLQKWLHHNPNQRSTIPELLADPFFMEAEMALSLENFGLVQEMQRREAELQGEPRECCICGDNFHQADGLDCPANQPAHFACADCLSGHVQTESLKDMDQLRKTEGKVWCPLRLHGCKAKQPYEMAKMASRVTPEAFQALIEAIRKLQEQKLSQNMEVRYKKQLKEEMERYERLSAEQRQVQQARVHILEEILTLKCPRRQCRTVFLDFDGCFALTCRACGCGFCAWCLQDCGGEKPEEKYALTHRHVPNCKDNAAPGSFSSTFAMFEQAHRARRKRLIEEYLRTFGHVELRRKVLEAVRPNLRQLGIHLELAGPLGSQICR